MPAVAPFDVVAFFDEPLRPAQVAATSPRGVPLLGSLWFLFAHGRFWFSSWPDSPLLTAAVDGGSDVAVIVDDFSPPDSIRQVRVRGPGRLEPHDPDVVERIYGRYLGGDVAAWPEVFRSRMDDPSWALWTVLPRRGLAVVFPNFEPREMRWGDPSESPFPSG